ncbi:MAG: hypothetical protein Q8P97_01145 [bacterium]|nr:hypothetical protein [bacterium]
MSIEILPEEPGTLKGEPKHGVKNGGGRELGYDGLGKKLIPPRKRWVPGEKQEIPPESVLAELSAAERGLEYHRGLILKSLTEGKTPELRDLNQLERYAEQVTSIVKELRNKIEGREQVS